MSTSFSMMSNKEKVYHVNFRSFEKDDIPSFMTFEISHDDNTLIIFLNNYEQYQSFMTTIASTVQKEIENPTHHFEVSTHGKQA